MNTKICNPEQKAKLTQLINKGIGVLTEIAVFNEGRNDTSKAVAKRLRVRSSILKRAVKIVHKLKFGKTQANHKELTTIFETAGGSS